MANQKNMTKLFNEEILYVVIARNYNEIIASGKTQKPEELLKIINGVKKDVEKYKLVKNPIEGESIKEEFIVPDVDKVQGEV